MTEQTGAGGLIRAIGVGAAGTAAVTLLNELGRRTIPGAPHAEALGMRAVGALARRGGWRPDRGERFGLALAGEIVSNTAWYGLAARARRRPLAAGVALGVLAGAGAIVLPPWLGLGRRPTRQTPRTAALAFVWYLAAGVAAGAAARALRPRTAFGPA